MELLADSLGEIFCVPLHIIIAALTGEKYEGPLVDLKASL